MKISPILLLIASAVFSLGNISAQKLLSGSVFSDGEPLIGATILVKNSSVGTTTDYEGLFELSVPDDAEMLVISYTGYSTKNMSLEIKLSLKLLWNPTRLCWVKWW